MSLSTFDDLVLYQPHCSVYMKKLTYLLYTIALVSATQLNVTLDSLGWWRLPISARLVSSGHEVNACVSLDINGNRDFVFEPYQGDNSVPPLVLVDSLIIDDHFSNRIVIPTGHFSIPVFSDPGLWNTVEASVGAAFDTSFARRIERFILTPCGDGSLGLLVLNTPTPEIYAFEGRWFYVNSLNNLGPEIEASVAVGNNATFSPVSFVIVSNVNRTIIPHEAFQEILVHLERAGFNIVESNHNDELSRCVRLVRFGAYTTLLILGSSNSELAQILPPIHFEMVSGTQRFRISLFPEDYIESVDHGHTLSIWSKTEGPRYFIGTNVLRRLAFLIDYENHLIGFAEPVDEF